mgnify:CR=1 FL=1
MKRLNDEFPVEEDDVHWSGNDCERVGIRVIGRGDALYFQSGDRWFMCDMSAVHASICISKVKKWSNGQRVTDADRKEILGQIAALYGTAYGCEPEFT